MSVLKTIVDALGDVTRKLAIGIGNSTNYTWKARNVYFSSGTSDISLVESVNSGTNSF